MGQAEAVRAFGEEECQIRLRRHHYSRKHVANCKKVPSRGQVKQEDSHTIRVHLWKRQVKPGQVRWKQVLLQSERVPRGLLRPKCIR